MIVCCKNNSYSEHYKIKQYHERYIFKINIQLLECWFFNSAQNIFYQQRICSNSKHIQLFFKIFISKWLYSKTPNSNK